MGSYGYFELSSGAAGDMLLAAVLDAARQQSPGGNEALSRWSNSMSGFLELELGARIEIREVIRGGLAALKVDFFVGNTHADHHGTSHHHGVGSDIAKPQTKGHHHGRHLKEIVQIIDRQVERNLLAPEAGELAKNIFGILAEAEAKVHGTSVEKVHFHEVGAFDSIMDIAGFANIWTSLNFAQVTASAVTVGSGIVQTEHGKLGVPPPAVVEILKKFQIPTSGLTLPGECLTPTGAACLAAIVNSWGPMPGFKEVTCQGVGAGTREIENKPNVVRFIIGVRD